MAVIIVSAFYSGIKYVICEFMTLEKLASLFCKMAAIVYRSDHIFTREMIKRVCSPVVVKNSVVLCRNIIYSTHTNISD